MTKLSNAFININRNIKSKLESGVGTTILGKTITYIVGNPVKEDTILPAIIVEDASSAQIETAEIGGRHRLTVDLNVWVHAGGTGNEKTDEGMKQIIKGLLYSTFAKKSSLAYYDYINNIADGYFKTDISLRNSTPTIYSKLDAHKCVGNLTIELLY